MFFQKFSYLLMFGCLILRASCQSMFMCESEGRFRDSSDCGSYFECIREESGGFAQGKGFCGGEAFDEKIGGCVGLTGQFQNCQPKYRTGRSITSDPSLKALCNGETAFSCGNCKTEVSCLGEGIADIKTCPDGWSCMKDEAFGGGVCKQNSQVPECSCDTINAIEPDPYSDIYFAQCSSELEREIYQCPINMVYDSENKICSNPDNIPACSGMGTFVNPSNCTIHFSCIQTSSNGWLQTVSSCPELQFYDEASGSCTDACQLTTASFTCTTEGRYRDPTNCQYYIECVIDNNGDFSGTKRSCIDNYIWDDTKGFCIQNDGSCEPDKESVCERPANCA